MENINAEPAIRFNFKLEELNSKIINLENNGFKEYLNTWEKETVDGYENMNHVILTCTKGHYNGMVVDIYFNEQTNQCWLEYSGQHNDTKIKPII